MADRNLKLNQAAANRQMACGIYARTALADPVAIVRQVRSCADRVVELGGEVEAVYADNGSPGTMIGPELRRLLDDARAGRLDCVVIEDLDRVARSVSVSYLLQELNAMGVDVQALKEERAAPSVLPFERARAPMTARARMQTRRSGSRSPLDKRRRR